MTRGEKIAKAKKLQAEYLTLRSNGQNMESLKVEREYISIRKELIDEVTTEVVSKKSIHISKIKDRVQLRPKVPKRETGIRTLDLELVHEKEYGRGKVGGFGLGNFIQFAGQRGAGKTTFLVKLIAGLSNYETTSWFNFEMSDEKAVDMLSQFEHKDIEYYDGSRDINDIVDEIKFLYADGVRHFVIDSMMKIKVNGNMAEFEKKSHISARLSELTSTLGINIYLINQMSQDSQKTGSLMMKHGNDAEYDADYLFFLVKAGTGKKDQAGQEIIDETKRYLVCNKNRPDHRTFTVEIKKSDIFGVDPEVIEYNIELPPI